MRKNVFIITLIIIILTILSIILFVQFNKSNEESPDLSSQAEQISITQDLETDAQSNINSIVVTTSSSQYSFEDARKKEIQDRIDKFGKNEIGIPVLMYHFFYDSSAGETGKDNNFLEISKFEQQLNCLKENDFFFPTFEELSQFINGEIDLTKKSVILTIDDGSISFFNLAALL